MKGEARGCRSRGEDKSLSEVENWPSCFGEVHEVAEVLGK